MRAIRLLRLDLVVIECNPAACALLNRPAEQLCGRSLANPGWDYIREDGSPFPPEEHPAAISLRTGQQVRNVVLTGNWPTTLTPAQLASLTTRSDGKDSPADRRSRIAALGETFFAAEPAAVVQRARNLPPAERYANLLNWVVPNAEHGAFRLYGDFTPTDVAPPLAAPPTTGIRVQMGGELVAPALELVSSVIAVGRPRDTLEQFARATGREVPEGAPEELGEGEVVVWQGGKAAAAVVVKLEQATIQRRPTEQVSASRMPNLSDRS